MTTVFLDRPEKRNAMGMPFFAQLPEVMAELGRDDGVRAIVVAGRGPAFSVGLDLTALASVGSAGEEGARPSQATIARRVHADVIRLQASISSVAECPKPVIAAIHGWCIGGGVDLTSACDIRLCSADAVFSVRDTAWRWWLTSGASSASRNCCRSATWRSSPTPARTSTR